MERLRTVKGQRHSTCPPTFQQMDITSRGLMSRCLCLPAPLLGKSFVYKEEGGWQKETTLAKLVEGLTEDGEKRERKGARLMEQKRI